MLKQIYIILIFLNLNIVKSEKKLALMYGAGNIGRGFIGILLHQAGYHVTFVDVISSLVDDINNLKKYNVEIVGDKPEKILVDDIDAINSEKNNDQLIEAITKADIITTAIGPSVLKTIAPTLAKGLKKRIEVNKKPLNIIACENMVAGSTSLKNYVYELLDEDTEDKVDQYVGFPNAAVDRIVPAQKGKEKLIVQVEPYAEWDVDEKGFKGELPNIPGMSLVENLEAYIERKLFSINTGHASIAYFAYQKGYTDIAQAMKDPEILDIVRRVWKETGTHLINKFGFDPISHWKYVETCENRFKNPYLSDDVTRVARGPKRKISHKDRLILPAREIIDSGGTPEALASVVAAALKYDYKEDKEAMEIQDFIKKNGIENAIVKYTGLEKYTKLFKLIMSYV